MSAWDVEEEMGRRSLPTTLVVEHQMEAQAQVARVRRTLVVLYWALGEAEAEIKRASGLVEKTDRRD